MIEIKRFLDTCKEKLRINGEMYIEIKVIPGATKTEYKEIMQDDTLKIAIAAKAEKNKANLVLTKFLAKEFSVDKENISILSGKSDRKKLLKVWN